MSELDDRRSFRLTVHVCQPHRRNDTGLEQIFQHLAGPDGWQLVFIADQHDLHAVWHRFEQLISQPCVDHRHFIDDKQLAGKRFMFIAAEPFHSVPTEQPMNRRRRQAGRLAHPLGRPSGRGGEHDRERLTLLVAGRI